MSEPGTDVAELGRPVTVVVADDHLLIREGVRALLESIAALELVGQAADGDEVIEVVRRTRPDVVIMDLHMPGTDGITATRRITAEHPGVAVLVVTMMEDDASVFAAMRAGARGYLLKGADQDELRRAINAVANGEAIFGPGIAARVLDLLGRPPTARVNVAFPELTAREREILDHLAAGRSNSTIARSLALSPRTVANHVSNIFAKLQVADRTEAAIRAREAGFGNS
ncbi:response regulator transcription factor [Parafrankia sp. EUN1f]|uniref:response regulator transcription factor n=2 Tax=Parafrankia sp. EUN1f TaxID=102897 RepID=UPI0001C47137|nr:response regulator transcription factor [Parafrankia sp. EUN1f]EFC79810.1 two component transcriptional regulator, LuxR family [Parafrankia sp. EUN1f]